MARKATLERYQRRSARGPNKKGVLEIKSDGSLDEFERRLKQSQLVFFKAADFPHTYCADVLGVSVTTIKNWLDDEKLGLRDKIALTRQSMTASAVKMIDSMMIEIVVGLKDIFDSTADEKLASDIGFELLAIMGVSKVNKSDSRSMHLLHQSSTVNVVDKTGLIEKAKNAPPEVQAAMAESVENLVAILQEHAGDAEVIELPAGDVEEVPDAVEG